MVSCSSRPGIARSRDALRAACRGIGATPVAAPAAPLPSRKPSPLSHPPASSHPALSPRPRVAAVLRSSVRGFWTPGKDRASKTRALKFTLAAIVALIPANSPCAHVSHSRLSGSPTPVVLCGSTNLNPAGETLDSACSPRIGYSCRGVGNRSRIPCVLFEGPNPAQWRNGPIAHCHTQAASKSWGHTTLRQKAGRAAVVPIPGVRRTRTAPLLSRDTTTAPAKSPPGPVSLSATFACASRPVQIDSLCSESGCLRPLALLVRTLRTLDRQRKSPAADRGPVSRQRLEANGAQRHPVSGRSSFWTHPAAIRRPAVAGTPPAPPQGTPQDGLAQAARPSVTPTPGGPASTPATPTLTSARPAHRAASVRPRGPLPASPPLSKRTAALPHLRSLSPLARAAMTASTRTGAPRVTRATPTGKGPELDAKRLLGFGERQSCSTVSPQLQRSTPATNRTLRTTRAHGTNRPAYHRPYNQVFSAGPPRIWSVDDRFGSQWPCGCVIGSLWRRQSGCCVDASCGNGFYDCQYTMADVVEYVALS
jgi:hypothetical protein